LKDRVKFCVLAAADRVDLLVQHQEAHPQAEVQAVIFIQLQDF
jgi:hypothetical protein